MRLYFLGWQHPHQVVGHQGYAAGPRPLDAAVTKDVADECRRQERMASHQVEDCAIQMPQSGPDQRRHPAY